MSNTLIGNYIFLLVILILGIILAPIVPKIEGFKDYSFEKTEGKFPSSVDKAILNTYPLIGKNETSHDDYSKIWWRSPIFTLGSYEQVTNNLKYRYNPDDGTCTTAEFCGALYHSDKKTKSNVSHVLPPVEEGSGARVGYFRTEPNDLFFSIPTNENILY